MTVEILYSGLFLTSAGLCLTCVISDPWTPLAASQILIILIMYYNLGKLWNRNIVLNCSSIAPRRRFPPPILLSCDWWECAIIISQLSLRSVIDIIMIIFKVKECAEYKDIRVSLTYNKLLNLYLSFAPQNTFNQEVYV